MGYNEAFRASSPPISLELQMGSHKQSVAFSTAIYTERFRGIILCRMSRKEVFNCNKVQL